MRNKMFKNSKTYEFVKQQMEECMMYYRKESDKYDIDIMNLSELEEALYMKALHMGESNATEVIYMMLFGGYALGEAQARISMELNPDMSAADRDFWKAMQDPKTYTNTDPDEPPYLVEDEEAEDD